MSAIACATLATSAAAQVAAVPDSASAEPALPDSTRAITVTDSLGIPGTLKGQTEYDPLEVKDTLRRMGSNEVLGQTTWERKKNPRTALICSMVLPGLGQTYNGRRLKVGLMVGASSYYIGNIILNWRRYQRYSLERDLSEPGSRDERFNGDLAVFYKEEARTYLWWSGAVWLLGLLDSWIDAHLYDVREYTPPPPPATAVPRTEGGQVSYLTVGIGLSFK